MDDQRICTTCGHANQSSQGECKNCGAILEDTQKMDADTALPMEGPSPAAAIKSDRKLPVWLTVREMLVSAQAHALDERTADALEIYYQALILAASHRRDNPTIGAVIQDILVRIEKMEGSFITTVPSTKLPESIPELSKKVDNDQQEIPQPLVESKQIPENVASMISPNGVTRPKEIVPENIDSLELKVSWDRGDGDIYQIAFSPSGALLAITTGKDACLINASDEKDFRILRGHLNRVYSLGFSPDGKILATGSSDWDVNLWTVGDRLLKHKLEGHTEDVFSVAFSPDGQQLASGSADHTVRLWKVRDGTLLNLIEQHTDCVESVAFSPDGSFLASASDDGSIYLWNRMEQSLGINWRGHKAAIASLVFSPSGDLLASSSDDGAINLWKPSNGGLIMKLRNHQSSVESLAFSPNGLVLASGAGDGCVCLWQVSDGELLITLEHEDSVNSVVFSPDGGRLAVANQNGVICFWEIAQ